MSARPLPEGSVALLFLDLEGSTRLVHRLGERWAGVLDRSRALCRSAWAAHHGQEVSTEGDSFFVAFSTTRDAVAAAAEAQRSIADEPWPEGAELRARCGVHTGRPQVHEDGYVGVDVHLAARVAAAAHGGQVLLSTDARAAVLEELPRGLGLRDLGQHRFKDFDRAVGVWQLVVDGRRVDFPALRTAGVIGNLPPENGALIGRDVERAELLRALVEARERLVTLTGPGGSGKTALGLTVARQAREAFPDGVFFVPLATADDVPRVWSGIARTLRLDPIAGTDAAVLTHLEQRRALLVLDNLEQVEQVDLVVRRLLEETTVSVLATSRRRVGVAFEREHAVPPLEPTAAVELFAARANRVRRSFRVEDHHRDDVAAICSALDGLPLAIELAASRVKLLSPAAIRRRLGSALDLTSVDRGVPERHRTLREAIDWSYRLLDAERQQLLVHLGVFVGGADLAAISAVVPNQLRHQADLLSGLADLQDASLVVVTDTEDGEPRFELLDTIGLFALDMLEQRGEAQRAVASHAQYFYDLANWLRDLVIEDHGAERIVKIFERELGNFDVVTRRLPTGVTDDEWDDPLTPLTVVSYLQRTAHYARRYEIPLRWGRRAMSEIDEATDPDGTLMVLARNCLSLWKTNRFAEGVASGSRAERLGRVLIATRPVDSTRVGDTVHSAYIIALSYTVWSHLELGDQAAALRAVETVEGATAGQSDLTRLFAVNARLDYYYALADWEESYRYLVEIERIDPAAVDADRRWFEARRAEVEVYVGLPRAGRQRLARLYAHEPVTGDPERALAWAVPLGVAAATTQPLLCARAFGAIAAHRLRHDQPAQPREQRHIDTRIAPARASVSAEAWDAAWDAGEQGNIYDLIVELLDQEIPES